MIFFYLFTVINFSLALVNLKCNLKLFAKATFKTLFSAFFVVCL